MTVTVLYYGGASLLDKLIFWFTRARVSHVALMVRDGERVTVYEELAAGLKQHDGDEARNVARAAVAYKLLPVAPAEGAAIEAFFAPLLAAHARYSVAQLLLDALQRVGISVGIDRGSEMVCSGVVAVALSVAAGYRFNKDPRAVTPGDLYIYFAPVTLGAPL